MKINVINTLPIYRRMLAADNLAEREAIYRDELLSPFAGMFRIFGGDGVSMARLWGLYPPEDYDGEEREALTALLDALEAHGAWEQTSAAFERGRAAFVPYADRISLGDVACALVLANVKRTMTLDRGYSGFGGIPGWVMVSVSEANDYSLPRLSGASVHELNHNVRFSVYPFNPMRTTVGDYIVAEGLAESFAAELFGPDIVGHFVTDFSDDELATARRVIGGALGITGFDTVRSYIFGDVISEMAGRPKVGVPNFAGYAMGFRVVQRYQERTGKSVAEATFVPTSEIIAESQFFADS